MSKARTLADFISDGSEFADGTISVAEVSGAAPLASPTFTADVEVTDGTTPILSLRKTGSDKATIKFDTSNGLQMDNSSYNYPIKFDGSSFVFNEYSNDADFRVESDGNTHMLFVDASENAVAIGSASTSTAARLRAAASSVASGDSIVLIDSANDGNVAGNHLRIMSLRGDTSAYNLLTIDNVAGEILNISGNGSVVFNEAGGDRDFRVESDSETHMLFVDAANNRVGIGTNGPSSTLSVDGDILSNWGNSGYQKIGIAGRTANIFSTTGRTLILTGADAIAGPQAMAGGDVIVRGGKGRANTGLNTYAGHLYLEGGEHTTSGETGGAGNVYIKTAGNVRASFYAGGDIALSTNNFSQFFKLDHSTNQIMIGQTLSNDAELLTLGSAGQATYSSGASEGMLGLVRFNNTGNSNQHSGLFFRVTSNNGSNNSNASIGLKQPSSSSHNSQFYFNLRSQSQNRHSQYGLIDSENGWIFNDGSDSYNDFRVESDNDTHALFVNSGSNRLGIFESSGENTVNISVSGSSSHTSGSLPPGITLYANNSNDGTGNAITWKDATGAQGIAGIASFRTGQYGGYGRDLRFYVNDTASTNAYQEGMRLNAEQMLSSRTVGWSVNSLVEPTVVAASEASGSGAIYLDYYLDSSTTQWSTAHFFCTISEIDGGASGNAAAWYLVRCHHYNGGVGFSVRDSGGDTGSFTTAFSDSGGTDPIAVRVGFTGLSGTAVLNVMGANFFGVEKVV